jgi:hypothetical protein
MISNRFCFLLWSIFAIVIFTLLHTSCKKGHLHGVGKMIIETRYPHAFHSVNISDNISVNFYFSESEEKRLVIQGGELLLPNVKTIVKDSILYLSNENKWNWIRNYSKSNININIYTDQIQYIKYNGYKDIYFFDTLKVTTFEFETSGGMGKIDVKLSAENTSFIIHKGSPDLYISGNSQDFYLYNNAHGKVNALDFNVQDLKVHVKSTADCYVAPHSTIGATIEYLGNVYYKNNPQILWLVEKHTGKLIKLD